MIKKVMMMKEVMKEEAGLYRKEAPRPVIPHSLPHALSLIALVMILSAVATAAPADSRKAGEVVIEKVTLTSAATGPVEFELGTLYVPENRSDPKSRIIGVGFARFRALQPSGAPSIFVLPGGPGGSFINAALVERRDQRAIEFILRMANSYRGVGEVVLVDQRGYSLRGEVLKFKYRTPEQPLDQPGSLARSTAAYVVAARSAVAEYARKGVDLGGYTILECADDVNDLRRALGYDRITLVARGFGSQLSFAVMRRHPDIVARALLSSVEPLDYGYNMPSHVFAAVQRMWWEFEKDKRLRPYLPAGGFMEAAREVLRRLDRAPVKVKVKDEKTGEEVTVALGREDFQKSFPVRTDKTEQMTTLLSLYHGHYEKWATEVLKQRRSQEKEDILIGPLIDTSLGVTPRRRHLLRTDSGTEFLGQWNFDSYLATAEVWPSPDVGDEFRTEVVSRVPVVFAQGDWDPLSPVENTLHIAPYFPQGRVLIAVNGNYGVTWAIMENLPDVWAALMEFLQTGNTVNVPARVTLPVPKFEVPDFPPPSSTRSQQSVQ